MKTKRLIILLLGTVLIAPQLSLAKQHKMSDYDVKECLEKYDELRSQKWKMALYRAEIDMTQLKIDIGTRVKKPSKLWSQENLDKMADSMTPLDISELGKNLFEVKEKLRVLYLKRTLNQISYDGCLDSDYTVSQEQVEKFCVEQEQTCTKLDKNSNGTYKFKEQ